jgi:small subunit ribosomal protein S20
LGALAGPAVRPRKRGTHPFIDKDRSNMANSAQARKRARQAEATRKRNASLRSELRTAVKKVRKSIETGDKAVAAKQLVESQSVLDRIADKKIVHKNLASRTKSRLAQAIKAMA